MALRKISVRAEMAIYAGLLLGLLTQLLYVDSFHHFLTVGHAGLLESLTAAEFLYNTGSFKFAFEFLESSLNVFAFFNLYDYHFSCLIDLLVGMLCARGMVRVHNASAKLCNSIVLTKFFGEKIIFVYDF